jgi:hypothetical protein
MSDEVYRCMLVTAFMAQVLVVSFIPVIGSTLVFVHLCWLYSLYSFESVGCAAQHTAILLEQILFVPVWVGCLCSSVLFPLVLLCVACFACP